MGQSEAEFICLILSNFEGEDLDDEDRDFVEESRDMIAEWANENLNDGVSVDDSLISARARWLRGWFN